LLVELLESYDDARTCKHQTGRGNLNRWMSQNN